MGSYLPSRVIDVVDVLATDCQGIMDDDIHDLDDNSQRQRKISC